MNNNDWMTKAHSMGTSIMAVRFNGGVVVGADSRTTTGSYIANRVSDKLTPVHERIYCCRSGSAADTQAIADYVKYYLSIHSIELGELPATKTAAALFQQLCYTNKNALQAGIIIGGWDKRNGGQVYSIPLGGSLVNEPFATGGSGSTYIYGYCDANYRPDMTRQECEDFVVRALSLAMARDGSSGGVVRVAIIDESGVERKMVPGNQLPYN
ncbi:proteasome subunit beta type 6 [Planoprotostelium fungivorum]|uniref:Proteasome subunit beta n=1 Tax=Planoprotostelium fungivorum TaxID=1890364 RepID=A0A2P6NKL6_9EUKA|nr:proteasome subunit beta type 6 [Planoprotostelium fungivorum]